MKAKTTNGLKYEMSMDIVGDEINTYFGTKYKVRRYHIAFQIWFFSQLTYSSHPHRF